MQGLNLRVDLIFLDYMNELFRFQCFCFIDLSLSIVPFSLVVLREGNKYHSKGQSATKLTGFESHK